VFWALRDRGFPRSDLARFEAAFPRHETVELPEAKHFFFEDFADLVVDEISAFVSADKARQGAAEDPR
jgi:haloalkane dehalogenase